VSDDRPTEFWDVEDDPEATGRLQGTPRAPAPDEELTQVRRPAAPAPTVRQESARDWLESESPPVADGPPARRAVRLRRRRSPLLPRIVAPIVFLAAVIAVFSLTVDSGLLDDSGKGPGGKKTPAAGATGAAKKYYVVKKGDTLSEIAGRFDTSPEELQRLNPRMSLTTLNPGEKIKLPAD